MTARARLLRRSLRRILRPAAALVFPALLLSGCAQQKGDQWVRKALEAPLKAAGEPVESLEARWARYHWYYPEITHTLKVRHSSDGHYSGPVAHVHFQMIAKALTQEGAAYAGTLHLEGWNSSVISLDVVHLDSAGRNVPVSMDGIRKSFRRKGLIVVPRVAKGSTVAVRLIRGPYSSINHWEVPMDRRVPVLRSTIRLSAAKGILFDTKAYNGLGEPTVEKSGRFSAPHYTWTAERVMPLADLPFADGLTARPRFLLTNRNNAYGTTYKSWKSVARGRRKSGFDGGLLNLAFETRKQARLLAQGTEEADKARRILAWVQDNVSLVPEKAGGMGLDAVLENRKGTAEQVASLLKAMYDEAGLPSEIVLTRPRDAGGLDPEAPNPNAVDLPLIVVTAGGREWAAYPFSSAFALGDYPPGLIGIQALSLEHGTLRPLPEPAHGAWSMMVNQEVHLDGLSPRTATVRLEGPAAAEMRAAWTEALARDPLEGCRRWLRAVGFTATIRKCSEQGLEDREKPFHLKLELERSGTWVEEAGGQTLTAPDLFTRPAWFYDSARTDAYFLPHDQIRKETVVFRTPAGKRLQDDIPCRDFDSDFLKVTCRKGAGLPVSYLRETLLRKGRHASADLKVLHAGLLDLDRIRESRLMARQDVTPPRQRNVK